MGLNNPRAPSEMGESKLDKNGGVYVGSWDPYVNLKKKTKSLLQKTVRKSIQVK